MAIKNSDTRPNGFITEREVDGERRSIRYYNDGRISSRSSSRAGHTLSRSTSSASVNRCDAISRVSSRSTSRSTSRSNSRYISRALPWASGETGSIETLAACSSIEEFRITSSLKAAVALHELLGSKESEEFKVETVPVRRAMLSSRPSSVHSNSRTGGNVLDRVAKIEARIEKTRNRCLGSISEEK